MDNFNKMMGQISDIDSCIGKLIAFKKDAEKILTDCSIYLDGKADVYTNEFGEVLPNQEKYLFDRITNLIGG